MCNRKKILHENCTLNNGKKIHNSSYSYQLRFDRLRGTRLDYEFILRRGHVGDTRTKKKKIPNNNLTETHLSTTFYPRPVFHVNARV